MVNPGAFRGARKEFLMGEKAAYALGVDENYASDAIALIQRRYLKRFPVDLPDDVEPTDEQLAAVDDDAADPEVEEPDPEKMTKEEYDAAMDVVRVRQVKLTFRKAQITRWMAYQYEKDHDLTPKESGAYNPYQWLIYKLTGQGTERPRAKTAVNVWRKTRREEIEEKVKNIAEENEKAGVKGKQKKASLISLRDTVAREMFLTLPDEEQRFWRLQATREHEEAVKVWKADVEGPIKKDPVEWQKCIQRLVGFVQPILDLVSEATGWKASMIIGGPEPAKGGQLNILSIHSGTTSGDVKMNFGRAERARFRVTMVPMYGSFLRKCYTPEECRARALPAQEGHIPLAELGLSNETSDYDKVPDQQMEGDAAGATITPTSSKSTEAGQKMTGVTSQAHGPASNPTRTNSTPGTAAPSGPSVPAAKSKSKSSKKRSAPPISKDFNPTLPAPPIPKDPTTASAIVSTTSGLEGEGGSAMDVVVEGENIEEDDNEDNPFPFTVTGILSPVPSPLPSPVHSRAGSPITAVAVDQTSARLPTPADASPDVSSPHPVATDRQTCPRLDVDTGVGMQAEGGEQGIARVDVGHGPAEQGAMEVEVGHQGGEEAAMGGGVGRRSSRLSKGGAEVTSRGGKRTLEDGAIPSSTKAIHDAPRKKKRTSAGHLQPQPQPQSTTEVSDAPPWFSKAKAMLMVPDLGQKWIDLVEAWMKFEASENYEETSNLASAHRPVVVKDWIQRARSPVWRPKTLNVGNIAAQFTKWWALLQPEWRGKKQVATTKTNKGEWDVLRKGGPNGLLSVMAALFFWGLEVQKNGNNEDNEWLEAMQDVDVVLACLVATK